MINTIEYQYEESPYLFLKLLSKTTDNINVINKPDECERNQNQEEMIEKREKETRNRKMVRNETQ